MGHEESGKSADSLMTEIGEQPSLLFSEPALRQLKELDSETRDNLVRMAMARQNADVGDRRYELELRREIALKPHNVEIRRLAVQETALGVQATRVRWSVALSLASLVAYAYAAAEQVSFGLGDHLLVIMPSVTLGLNVVMTIIHRKSPPEPSSTAKPQT